MTCKDCMHFHVCEKAYHLFDEQDVEKRCKHYKNKAEYAEVKHGEWIDKFNGRFDNPTHICSVCGEKALLECYINELDQWKYKQSLSIYCPRCGVKMDGGKDINVPTKDGERK